MSEIDLEAMRAKIKTHDLLDEHDGDFVVDLYTMVSEVERLRARVKEFEGRGTGIGELAVTGFTCVNHGLITPFPACPECENKGDNHEH